MRRLVKVGVVLGVMGLLGACGDDGGGETGDTGGGGDAAADVAADTAGPQDTGVVVDTAPDTQPPVDTQPPQDTTPPLDTTGDVTPDTGPLPDGKLGSPCATDDECGTDDDSVCFFGFCTNRCRVSGTDDVIPGACEGVSAATIFPTGGAWGCPTDLVFCMPGYGGGQAAICTKDSDCGGVGTTFGCAGAILISANIVDGICLPAGSRAAAGSTCAEDDACASLLCLGNDAAAGIVGECAAHCAKNDQCPDGSLCAGIGFVTSDESDAAGAWAGLCVALPGALGFCNDQGDCAAPDTCSVFIEPASLTPVYWCVEGVEGGAVDGTPCTADAECASGLCLFEGVEGVDAYCSSSCPANAADCPETMSCARVLLHSNGTPDNPVDDKFSRRCVFGGDGAACFTSAKSWCTEAGQACEAEPDGVEGIGSCKGDEPTGCVSNADCDDELACTDDTCDVASGDCSSALQADKCAIDGVCYDAGAPDPGDACQACDPATDTAAFSAAEDGTACDDGDVCTEGEACAGGTCTGGTEPDCDDGIACTVDTCEAGTGCAHANDGACPTYTTDVQPIYAAHCTPCHTGAAVDTCSGGACFVDFYAATQLPSYFCPGQTKGACTLARVLGGSMPQGKGCTGDPVADAANDACLDQTDLDTLEAWIAGGQTE